MDPTPYRTIAVASTFSPRFVQVLAEAKRIRDRFGSELQLIYVGEQNEETAKKFRGVLAQLALPETSPIHYQTGNPADGILQALKDHGIDLIVAGALEKEVVLHPFLGNVARRLVRDATCSVMLFTKPELEPKALRRVVFVADEAYSEHARQALQKTLQLALEESCERLYVIRIFTTFDEVRASRGGQRGDGGKLKSLDQEEAALEEFILSAGHTEVLVEARCIRGNTGFAASDFVHSVEADLLVIPVQSASGSSDSLPGNVSWITDVIPCNLWVIR